MISVKIKIIILGLLVIGGCATQNSYILNDGTESQLKIRQIQTKSFETKNKNLVLRNVISSMQDAAFVIDHADDLIGVVSGTKFKTNLAEGHYTIKMSVTVKIRGEVSIVRVNARHRGETIKNPKIYQDFFSLLSKSLFLSANDIN